MNNTFVDLSHDISPDTKVYPGDSPAKFRTEARYDTHGYQLTYYSFGSHTGTHIDAPSHLFEGGKCLDDYPIDRFQGRGITVDCRNKTEIQADFLKNKLGEEPPEFLLLYTAWDKKWGAKAYFSEYPVLSHGAAEMICSLPLKGIGIDAPSFDMHTSTEYENHLQFLRKDILLLENLTQLETTLSASFMLFCFPLKLRKAEACPSRICAML